MEIPHLRYQNLALDEIHVGSCIAPFALSDPYKFLRERSFFSGNCFLLIRRRWRNPVSQIRCSSAMEQRLKPRPKMRPLETDCDEQSESLSAKTQIVKQSTGLCSRIEELVSNEKYREALEFFEILESQGGDEVGSSTYHALVSACIGLNSIRGVGLNPIREVKRLCNYMDSNGFEQDQYMRNRVLFMHVKCGMMIDARQLFDSMPEKNMVSWNTILSGLVDSGDFMEAYRLFLMMWQEFSTLDVSQKAEKGTIWRDFSDCVSRSFVKMIGASSGLGLVSAGRQFHSCALKMGAGQNIFLSCALIDMYSKCGCIEDAQSVFDEMPEKTTAGWNCIIKGYDLHGYSEVALSMYYEMRDSGIKMDHFTFSIILSICARLGSLEHAKQAHADLVRHGFGFDIVANTALLDFYCKWGRMEDARHVFDKMPNKNVKSWNALIFGYGSHGQGEEAVELFEKMLQKRMKPNHVTFLAVLSACSYSGLSERGWEIFESMSRDHKIKPRAMHYACMIELLGREGLLDEAFALIRTAPFKPNLNMWAALLTACRIHENLELGKFAAEKLYGMDTVKLSNYVVLFNLYYSAGNLKEAAAVIQTLRRKGLSMYKAYSWIEVKKQSHVFCSGDRTHPQTEVIYDKVHDLMAKISKLGYVPEEKFLLPDVNEKDEKVMVYHSEKLAIAFGLISTLAGSSLQVIQSHRVCGDCHSAIKLIALVTGREIVLRDGSRFHHFKDGNCSCGDYW